LRGGGAGATAGCGTPSPACRRRGAGWRCRTLISLWLCAAAGRRVPLAADHDARRLLDIAHQGGEVLRLAAPGVGVAPPLLDALRHPHRHAERLGFFEAELDVLVHELGPEAEVEAPRQH